MSSSSSSNAYLAKPFDIDELLRTVAAYAR
jgi:hypothetical protein